MNNSILIYNAIKDKLLHLKETQKERLLNEIKKQEQLLSLSDKIFVQQMIQRKIDYLKNNLELELFSWEQSIKYKLIEELTKYILDSDFVSNIKIVLGSKGLEISCLVFRDQTEYYFETIAIIAGGYNIQCLHYRYLTKTKLPKLNINNKKYFKLVQELELIEYNYLRYKKTNINLDTEFKQKTFENNCDAYERRILTQKTKIDNYEKI